MFGKTEKPHPIINTIINRILKFNGLLVIEKFRTFKCSQNLHTMTFYCKADNGVCRSHKSNIVFLLNEKRMTLNWSEKANIFSHDNSVKNEFLNNCEKTSYFLLDEFEKHYKIKRENINCTKENEEDNFELFNFKLSTTFEHDTEALIKQIDDEIICYYLRNKAFLDSGIEITDKEMPYFTMLFKETKCSIEYVKGELKTTSEFEEFFNFKTNKEKADCIELLRLNYQI